MWAFYQLPVTNFTCIVHPHNYFTSTPYQWSGWFSLVFFHCRGCDPKKAHKSNKAFCLPCKTLHDWTCGSHGVYSILLTGVRRVPATFDLSHQCGQYIMLVVVCTSCVIGSVVDVIVRLYCVSGTVDFCQNFIDVVNEINTPDRTCMSYVWISCNMNVFMRTPCYG